MSLYESYKTKVINVLAKDLKKENILALPRIEKIVVNVGLGKVLKDQNLLEHILKGLALITGQKPALTQAKKSIANFKTREGQVIGAKVTLRGKRMYDFLERLLSVALPRTRDFHGLSIKSLDPRGNLTIGVKEHVVFPEVANEDVRNIFGLEVTIVLESKNRDEALSFYRALGFPIK